MRPVDYLIIFIVGLIVGLAAGYIRKAKKNGRKLKQEYALNR